MMAGGDKKGRRRDPRKERLKRWWLLDLVLVVGSYCSREGDGIGEPDVARGIGNDCCDGGNSYEEGCDGE